MSMVGKMDVGWSTNNGNTTHDQNQDRHHYECVGPP